MSDTPKTDWAFKCAGRVQTDFLDHARALERENAKLREALTTLRDTVGLHNTPALAAFVSEVLANAGDVARGGGKHSTQSKT